MLTRVGGRALDEPGLDPRDGVIAELRRENLALSRAIALLHEISNLVRVAQELEPTCYALLTGVTAGVGLGMNRAAIFLADDAGMLRGMAAVGPADRDEADRVWRAIEADAPDLTALYEAGLTERAQKGRFDELVRTMVVDPRSESALALAMRRGRLVVAEGEDLGEVFHRGTVMAAPLRGRSRVRGVLVGDCRFTERLPDEATRLVFDLLADHAGLAVESAERFERVAREARTDALTGLGSRRSFDARLGELTGAARDDGPSVGLLLLDLDDFKRLNDTFGHPLGDRVLAEVGRRLASALRAGEGFRYGGEELAVLLSGVSIEGLRAAAERVHQAVTAEAIEVPGRALIRVGVSIGAALHPSGRSLDAAELVRAADEALLAVKAAGKNHVRLG